MSNEEATHQRLDAVRQQFRDNIDKFGYSKLGVFDPAGIDSPFIYTIGLSKDSEMPELIVGGLLDNEGLSSFLDWFANQYKDGEWSLMTKNNAFTLEDDSEYSIRTVEIEAGYALEHFLIQAEAILGRPVFRVAQLQISDAQGRWPGDPDFDDKFKQPHFGAVLAS